jgi:hypothetical protein
MNGGARVVTRPAWLIHSTGLVTRAALTLVVGILSLVGLLTFLNGGQGQVGERQAAASDLGAQSFAEAFTRAYLTWDSTHPERHEREVGAFTSQALEPGAGLSVPARGVQRVLWTATVRDQAVSSARHLITVAAETSTGQAYYVSVSVERDRRGLMAVSRYPALVGAAPVDLRTDPVDEPEVEDGGLRTVLRRAIANYLGREGGNLRADLDPEAVVALPTTRLRLASIDSITWFRPARVAVELGAEGGGTSWTLRYELAVVKRDRWYVRSIQTNPTGRRSP